MPARALDQPVADERRLVGGGIVEDAMHLKRGRHRGFDLIEKRAELGGTVAGLAAADDGAGQFFVVSGADSSGDLT